MDTTVEVRWLWTKDNGYFAAEITFRPTERGMKVAQKVGKALRTVKHENESPEGLTNALGAAVVEYVSDNAEGCYDDYRTIRIPGEPEMVTFARACV